MNYIHRKKILYSLGNFLNFYLNNRRRTTTHFFKKSDFQWFEKQVDLAIYSNSWFTKYNVLNMLTSWSNALTNKNIDRWLKNYCFMEDNPLNIGVVMAGNIPMVGFHDLLCVFISGNKFIGKLSSDDKILIPSIINILKKIEPGIDEKIIFTQDKLKDFDAIIATGSDNTARYFNYYFRKKPNIIRKNRNGIGVLTGTETNDVLKRLGKDIFNYFGRGCRNVSKIFVPKNYDFNKLFSALEEYSDVINNHKYKNNYDFRKSVFLVNKEKHYDNGFLLLKESKELASAVSVVYYEYYDDLKTINQYLKEHQNKIQCIVSQSAKIYNAIPFGKSQQPNLWDYADGIDTLNFLLNFNKEN